MNTYRWTLLVLVLQAALMVAFAVSLALLIQNALNKNAPSYTPADQRAWERLAPVNTELSGDGIEEDAALTTGNTYHDFFSASCQLRSAAFFANGNRCYSMLYSVNVLAWPLANGSQCTRQGYYGVSCDSPDQRCCGGVIRTQSEASSGTVMLPCWVSKDPRFQFVYFGLPPYSLFPTTFAIAMIVVSSVTLVLFVVIVVVIQRWAPAEEIRRQLAFYARIIVKKLRYILCIENAAPMVRRVAVHAPTDDGNDGAAHTVVTIHGNDTAYASKIANSLSDSSFREAMKEACVVCLEPLGEGGDSVALLPCGHMFHAACINDVFNMRLNAAETPCCVCQRCTRLTDITVVSTTPTEATVFINMTGAVTQDGITAVTDVSHDDEIAFRVNPNAVVNHP
jgi:hypothetical protein